MRDRRDVLTIHKCRRTYDRAQGKFSFNISYETHTELTPRTIVVAEAFGLGIDESQKFPVLNTELQIGPSDIVLVTGDSGSGKSVLLRAIKADLGEEAADMADVHVDEAKPLIDTIGTTVEEALELLSRVGLNDAFLFLRTYGQLSDGQKYRYRIAKLMESGKQWWLMDEFCATLDRDTAKIIAFNVQKLARQQGKAAIAVTTHDDLFEDLSPSVHVHKRFGEEIAVKYFPNSLKSECSLLQEMKIQGGTLGDWRRLSCFHYRSHNTGASRDVFSVFRRGELCAVIVYCYPPPFCAGRRLILPKMTIKDLNKQLSIISRIVVHPKYRTIGLGEKLIRETLPRIGTRYVEMIAVMPRYNPFAERAGMRRVSVHKAPKEALELAEILKVFGFNLQLLGSQRYIRSKLEGLSVKQLDQLKTAFIEHNHQRFRKAFPATRQVAYGNAEQYRERVKTASFDCLIKLIRIESILLQTKLYLFWEQQPPPLLTRAIS